jgi:pyruvate dehydrogenase E2 component (dihydrolipoamide acetyltransferase)
VGDSLAENQDMVEVMTDKATVTIGAPKTGKVLELRGAVGDTVPVGNVIVVMDVGGSAADSASESSPAAKAPNLPPAPAKAQPVDVPSPSTVGAVGDLRSTLPGMDLVSSPVTASVARPQSKEFFAEQPLAAPAIRKLARELGVDLKRVEPTGKGGRVTREDVEARSRGAEAPPVQSAERGGTSADRATSESPGAPAAAEAPKPAPIARSATETRQPIRGMRRRIYENMARSKRTAAHFTYVDECDATGLIEMRDRLAPRAEARGVKLTYLPFIVKATVRALKAHPALNALVDDAAQEIVLRKSYDIGIATSTDQGLVVPVVRDADRLSLIEIAQEIARLGAAAKAAKIAPADLGGSTFTITSLGKLGGLFATPVINYPEVAIMGIHEIKRRPVVKGDQIVIGAEMLLSLSFDHRIIDGNVGAAFAQEIIGLLEEPERLLLEA